MNAAVSTRVHPIGPLPAAGVLGSGRAGLRARSTARVAVAVALASTLAFVAMRFAASLATLQTDSFDLALPLVSTRTPGGLPFLGAALVVVLAVALRSPLSRATVRWMALSSVGVTLTLAAVSWHLTSAPVEPGAVRGSLDGASLVDERHHCGEVAESTVAGATRTVRHLCGVDVAGLPGVFGDARIETLTVRADDHALRLSRVCVAENHGEPDACLVTVGATEDDEPTAVRDVAAADVPGTFGVYPRSTLTVSWLPLARTWRVDVDNRALGVMRTIGGERQAVLDMYAARLPLLRSWFFEPQAGTRLGTPRWAAPAFEHGLSTGALLAGCGAALGLVLVAAFEHRMRRVRRLAKGHTDRSRVAPVTFAAENIPALVEEVGMGLLGPLGRYRGPITVLEGAERKGGYRDLPLLRRRAFAADAEELAQRERRRAQLLRIVVVGVVALSSVPAATACVTTAVDAATQTAAHAR